MEIIDLNKMAERGVRQIVVEDKMSIGIIYTEYQQHLLKIGCLQGLRQMLNFVKKHPECLEGW